MQNPLPARITLSLSYKRVDKTFLIAGAFRLDFSLMPILKKPDL